MVKVWVRRWWGWTYENPKIEKKKKMQNLSFNYDIFIAPYIDLEHGIHHNSDQVNTREQEREREREREKLG